LKHLWGDLFGCERKGWGHMVSSVVVVGWSLIVLLALY